MKEPWFRPLSTTELWVMGAFIMMVFCAVGWCLVVTLVYAAWFVASGIFASL